jgi:hypothetical protein
VNTIEAHTKAIICLNLLPLDTYCIATATHEGIIKIHHRSGMLLVCLNINHPLPIKWSLTYSKQEHTRKQVIYAMKIIEILQQQATSEYEKNAYSIGGLASKFMRSRAQPPATSTSPTQSPLRRKQTIRARNPSNVVQLPSIVPLKVDGPPIVLMNSEYTSRDLVYDRIRKLYQSEL